MGRRKRKNCPDFTVYTDGGCEKNPGGRGGFGTVVVNNKTGELKSISKGFKSTTNNRMEMMAVIEGLKCVPKGSACLLISDSQLVVNCLSGLWEKKKNLDLWDVMDQEMKGLKMRTKWVKGHNGDILNEVCDTLATRALQGNLEEDTGYKGRKESPKNDELKIPESVQMSIMDLDPETDRTFTNLVGYEAIETFKKKYKKTFRDYLNLKTGGIDGWSSMPLTSLIKYDKFGSDAWKVIEENLTEYTDRISALRWFRRGLTLEDAIKKVRADRKIKEGNRNGSW